MSIATTDVIELLPTELASRLQADDFFADIPVVVADHGNVQAQMERLQAVVTTKSKKRGVAVIVLQVLADDDFPNLALGPLTLKPAFQIIEQREMNRDAKSGTGKSARQVARRIRDVIKTLALPGLVTDLTPDSPCIEPVQPEKEIAKNVVMYQVNFKCFECEADAPETPVANVLIDDDGAHFTITCATAGAAIWYSTDDSYPSPANSVANGGTSILYAGPVGIPSGGVTVRACGYLAGAIAGFVMRATITPN